jgi:uncharacterized protein
MAGTAKEAFDRLMTVDGFRYELRYIRDKEGREVDFVVVKDGMIQELIEVKLSDDTVYPHLAYYLEKLNPPKATQIVVRLQHPFSRGNLQIVDPMTYFHGE